MPGNFHWCCPICGKWVSGKTIPGVGLSRSNHLRSHGIWTSRGLTKENKEDNRFLKLLHFYLQKSGFDHDEALRETRRAFNV